MRSLRVFLPLIFAALSLSSFAQDLTKETKVSILDGIKKVLDEKAFVPGIDLKKWPEHLAKHQEAIDKAANDGEFAREVNLALREFGFSHIRLRNPRSAESRTRTFVIGVGLTARYEENALIVRSVTEKSGAETAGIKVGDKIIEVEGKAPDSATVLEGEEGTEVTFKVKSGEAEPREVKLKRERISTVRKETLTWVGEDTAVLRIFTFSRGYSRTNIEDLIKQATGKAKYLVLDLRSNGGGAVSSLQHLLSLLLPVDSTIGSFINRSTTDKYVEETKGDPSKVAEVAKWSTNKYKTRKLSTPPFDGKISVLINRASASASEICAMALREISKSPIVGVKSAGAVLASVYARLPNGWELQHPTSDYVTAGGVRLESNPIVPDVEETGRPKDGKDPVIEKALELLKKA